jgi:hypothetical protein
MVIRILLSILNTIYYKPKYYIGVFCLCIHVYYLYFIRRVKRIYNAIIYFFRIRVPQYFSSRWSFIKHLIAGRINVPIYPRYKDWKNSDMDTRGKRLKKYYRTVNRRGDYG